ncbi:hypothetical protein [Pseudomonas sp. BF-RE-29]|uniref:hypothetical protein n=1 Tax=Pseudomonas sp. BF-RE-29 TaxID=2832378 RepID=UPI001CBEFB49|nr:hypothetical protein [Pseudomonas sp. BF-RE-29]
MGSAKLRILLVLAGIGMLAGCTTAQKINRPGGTVEYQISCGAATSWGVCYSRAQEECPDGYKTIEEDQGFNRKELKISCGK